MQVLYNFPSSSSGMDPGEPVTQSLTFDLELKMPVVELFVTVLRQLTYYLIEFIINVNVVHLFCSSV